MSKHCFQQFSSYITMVPWLVTGTTFTGPYILTPIPGFCTIRNAILYFDCSHVTMQYVTGYIETTSQSTIFQLYHNGSLVSYRYYIYWSIYPDTYSRFHLSGHLFQVSVSTTCIRNAILYFDCSHVTMQYVTRYIETTSQLSQSQC